MSKMTEQWKGHLSQIRVKLLLVRGKETLHPHNSRHTRIRQLVTLSLEPVPRSSCSSSEEASRLCWWRMTGLTGPTVLLLVALCASSAQEDNVTLEVQYPQRSIVPARGSSVKLSCDAIYDVKLCGLLRVAWYSLTTRSAELTELTEPSKYFTTVNETDDSVRRRQVVTEIFNLTPKDDGQFQCTAECETGTTGMGHYISITVGG